MNPSRHRETAESLQRLESLLQKIQPDLAGPLLEIVAELQRLSLTLEEQRAELARQAESVRYRERMTELRLGRIEKSLAFQKVRSLIEPLIALKGKAGQALLRSPLHSLFTALRGAQVDESYARWVDEQAAWQPSLDSCRVRAAGFARQPLISVIMPVHRPNREWLEQAVESVEAQAYPRWELCVCDDASEAWVRDYFAERVQAEPRLRFAHSAERLGISGALNRALELAQGEYVAFLDQDDLLSPYALYRVAEALQESDADLLYSDEDLIDAGSRPVSPVFKPDWSPDLLLSSMYICHLLVVSRAAMSTARGFRSEFDGAQDFDLALRMTDGPAVVLHIPEVLYHWRTHTGSTAANPASKPYTVDAGRRAVSDTLRRRGLAASVAPAEIPNVYDVRWSAPAQPLTSLVICSRNAKLLARCLSAIREVTTYPRREIVVVQHVTGNREEMDRLLATAGVKLVQYGGPFHFSRMNNLGATAAEGEILVFLNDDTEPITPSWLERLVAQCERPDVGVVGAKLLYPSGALQHAGMAIGINDGCGHTGRGAFATPYWRWTAMTREVSSVTGACLAIRKELFVSMGGFDDFFPVNYNDADLCLRVRAAGYRVLYDAGAVLRHYECRTRTGGVSAAERERWRRRWAVELVNDDPFYNRNLTQIREDASLRSTDEL